MFAGGKWKKLQGIWCKHKNEIPILLRERLDPFELSEIIDQKLQRVWDLAHYRYKPKDIKRSTKDLREQLSNEEKETLEEISQIFGIEVYVRTHKEGELVTISHG